jgi:hypothetical protein
MPFRHLKSIFRRYDASDNSWLPAFSSTGGVSRLINAALGLWEALSQFLD